MSENLKNRPFCGASNDSFHITITPAQSWQGEVTGYTAECYECAALGPQKDTKAEAIAAWNTRAAPAPEAVADLEARAREMFAVELEALETDYARRTAAAIRGGASRDAIDICALRAITAALAQRPGWEGLEWACERWKAEVANRPIQNIHRRSLDDAWRQVIRRFGGDDVALIGPCHDALIGRAS